MTQTACLIAYAYKGALGAGNKELGVSGMLNIVVTTKGEMS